MGILFVVTVLIKIWTFWFFQNIWILSRPPLAFQRFACCTGGACSRIAHWCQRVWKKRGKNPTWTYGASSSPSRTWRSWTPWTGPLRIRTPWLAGSGNMTQTSIDAFVRVTLWPLARTPVLRIRDLVTFWPLDPDLGSGIGFFLILDPGCQTHIFESLVTNFWEKF